MSAQEMYDYLSIVTPDYSTTSLSISAQETVVEEGFKNQVIHLGDDNSEERITLNDGGAMFSIEVPFPILSESDAGTIMDFYHDAAKANGIARSFKFLAYDGHTYVVRFDCKLSRSLGPGMRWGVPTVRFRVLGKAADI